MDAQARSAHAPREAQELDRPSSSRSSAPTLAAWGTAGGILALYLLEPTPIARTDIFSQLPVVGGYWAKKLEAREQKD
ncbi:hypothetical protein HDU87_006889 [Geranomyces variabilis]|uniref:Uncharacterized protein n=1 Tax=Geranomyces variabilis TaxID=109894 RepID=A0AAD5TH46_9FUNG|nr:hypothetical protein HDU87_006889 [Geranomyces variabilis]